VAAVEAAMSENPNRPPLTWADVEAMDPDELLRGYRDGFSGAPWPKDDPSPAYEHGRRNGANDRAGVVDEEQRRLARERSDALRRRP
jgi:hypothetical protein